uniref:Uncharacterized protein n=1 Tax=Leptobrachium leishanense TaxID=445787 RepID=A0A8C5PN30_9ANUR
MGDQMDVKKLIGKTLKPARPIRHGVSVMGKYFCFNWNLRNPEMVGSITFITLSGFGGCQENEKFCFFFKSQLFVCASAGRITYSREFLLELSYLSISRKRPLHLPDHPIILDRPNTPLYTYLMQNWCAPVVTQNSQ